MDHRAVIKNDEVLCLLTWKDVWDICLAEKKQVKKEHEEFNSIYVKFYKHIHMYYQITCITKMLTIVISGP